MLAVALNNIYIYMLQYLYAPSPKGIAESQRIEKREFERYVYTSTGFD